MYLVKIPFQELFISFLFFEFRWIQICGQRYKKQIFAVEKVYKAQITIESKKLLWKLTWRRCVSLAVDIMEMFEMMETNHYLVE